MGDFFAGVFAPLAFLGLMVTIQNHKNDTQDLLNIEKERNKASDPFFIWIFKDIVKHEEYYSEHDVTKQYYIFKFQIVNIRGIATTTTVFIKGSGIWCQNGKQILIFEKNTINSFEFLIDCDLCKSGQARREIKIECINEMGKKLNFYYDLTVTDYRDEFCDVDGFDAMIAPKEVNL